ncbi:MAG: lysophospholipid acyltransferase family protein, partial [Candidatus Poribacteria bacterium]|nr:lysophospholipid acyltransferase family protein [Candidatus Poribacteria bacterium]
RCFQNLGKNFIEFIRFPHTSSEKNREIVTFEGKAHIDGALAQGNGAIILTGHFGNWELLAANLVEQVAPLTPVARRLRSRRLDALVRSWRVAAGYSTIDRDNAARDILRCLKRNELIGVLVDVDTSVEGVFVDFFGRPAFTPYSPVAIALKTGAPVLPTFIIRQPDDSHRVIVEPPLKLKKTGNRDQDFLSNTQMFTGIIESYVRRYPEQWIWMHERWKKQPGDVIDS